MFTSFELSDEQKLALVFVREVGAIDNITYRQLTGVKSYRASKDLGRMAGYQLLEVKKHSNQTYYVIGEELKARIRDAKKVNPPTSDSNPLSQNVYPPTSELLSTDLQDRIRQIGRRTRDKDLLLGIVVDLCKITPRSITEIAKIINRTDNYVKHDIVAPLREAGKLTYTIPDMINHPEQKYKVVEK
jgi:ATP-dependent DNA helicase RecG